MALNILEVIDVAEGGDKVDEGFTKCLNNWQALSAELLPGYMRRSQFTWVTGGTTLTVGGGIYEVNGTLARITSSLTTTAHGLTANGVYIYLYIDYSAIPATGIIDNTDLIWSLTGPTWSHTKLGWYNGNDRCIFGEYCVSNLMEEFEHFGNKVLFGDDINILNAAAIAASFTDVAAVKFPTFSIMFPVAVRWTWVDTECTLAWRTNGSASAAGAAIAVSDANIGPNASPTHLDIITDTSGIIEMLETSASTNTCTMDQLGFYLPDGM